MSEGRRALLYARVSTEEQARHGYSLRQQLEELRAYCKREGYKVVAEVEDPGYSGLYLERPGLDQVRDLVEAGGVSVVVAQDADRISREPAHRALLDEEMERYCTRLMALDDWGDDSHEGQLLRYMKGWVSKGESLKFAERSRRNLVKKVKEGRVIRGNQAPYGFRYAEDGETLLISEPEMGVVRRIFHMVGVEGHSLGEVQRTFKREGIPSAMGGGWPRSTIRYLLLNDLYRPLSIDEVSACGWVSPQVVRALDEKRVYGLWTWKKKAVKRWIERAPEGGYRKRVKNTDNPRDEWLAVPVDVSEASLSREQVETVRTELGKNQRRQPSTRAKRLWQLSGGLARCTVCGNGLSPHTVHGKDKIRPYYRCYTRFNTGLEACTNGRSTPAVALEEAVWEAVWGWLSQPDLFKRAYEKEIERRQRAMRGDPEKEARSLSEKLEKLEKKESYLLDVASDRSWPKTKLQPKLDELDRQRENVEEALRSVRNRKQSIEQLQNDMKRVWWRFNQIRDGDLRHLKPEARSVLYKAMRLGAKVDKDSAVVLTGTFSEDVSLTDLIEHHLDRTIEPPEQKKVVVTPYISHPCTS